MADLQARLTPEEALHLVDLAELAARAPNLENLAATLLPDLATMTRATAAVLFLEDPRLLAPLIFQRGLPPEAASPLEGLLAGEFRRLQQVDQRAPSSLSFSSLPGSRLHLFPLCSPGVYHGPAGAVEP